MILKERQMTSKTRRVIYGLDDKNRSAIVIDDMRSIDCPGGEILWHSATTPAVNSSNEDSGARPFDPAIMYDHQGSSFSIFCLKPDNDGGLADLYSTDTTAYITVVSGRVEFHSDTGKVELGAGDVAVVRGANHAARAIGDEPAITTVVMVPSIPLKAASAA